MTRWLDRAPGIPEPGKRERGGEGGKEKEEEEEEKRTQNAEQQRDRGTCKFSHTAPR